MPVVAAIARHADQLQGEHGAVVDDVADLELAQGGVDAADQGVRVDRRAGERLKQAALPKRPSLDGVSVTPSV